MKKNLIKFVLASALLFGSFTLLRASVEPVDTKCKTDHTLTGFCDKNVEGAWKCISSQNDCDCCHSAS